MKSNSEQKLVLLATYNMSIWSGYEGFVQKDQDGYWFMITCPRLENILPDGDLSPNLVDFGLAKLVGRDFSHVLTTTRGTRGYLAPEWISDLPITPKVDVYSFGTTLLEIISGRRNLDLKVQDSSLFYFPPWSATQIQQGNTMNIVEEGVAEEANMEEVRSLCVVALLCIQEDEEVRPSMMQVVQMLEGKVEPQTPQVMDRPVDRSDTSNITSSHVTS
ncbi:hypothetical protein SUGI_0257170 [Cryptomeria japonica]|nr:hypothetical protein SUGI_0257170 [Cryptomeria japonica]